MVCSCLKPGFEWEELVFYGSIIKKNKINFLSDRNVVASSFQKKMIKEEDKRKKMGLYLSGMKCRLFLQSIIVE